MVNDLELQEKIDGRGKEKGKLINEWNSWFSSAKRYVINETEVNLKCSIDRITIVGELRKFVWVRDNLEPITLDFEMVWMVFEDQGVARQVRNGWILLDKYGENIAYAERVKFDKNKGRVDFNPNKIRPFLHGELKRFIHKLFDNPHFSRADVACDIFNLSDDFIRQYRIVDPVSFKPIYGANGLLETAYWGSRSSERQVRMYNKRLEQTKKKEIVPEEIESWWRLEVQLRRAKAEEWNSVVFESLESFSSPHYLTLVHTS
ncbi:replication initiation factor family protein [Streptococcus pseudoporcinus]|uniref:Replication initiation factor family protein n=1 Tax=Streptococcus pseudoporcinus TaxID=361101 RepID=A0A4V6L4N5_9STRE|nr:replication initiation factor domain-containing protein [Streptococcus pseudoporcinus]VTS30317.1 replication initiation factor family protein [Streptococcus pseudoporcinus]